MIKLIIILLFVLIVWSLGAALFSLLKGGEGRSTAKALTVRIALSILAFVILMLGFALGLIEPHGIQAIRPPIP